jgi:hypothetical protein
VIKFDTSCGLLRVGFSIILVWSLVLTGVAGAQTHTKPNILVIFGDDIGQTNISAYSRGLMGFTTPNIDRIGHEGGIFVNYYGSSRAPQAVPRSSSDSPRSEQG